MRVVASMVALLTILTSPPEEGGAALATARAQPPSCRSDAQCGGGEVCISGRCLDARKLMKGCSSGRGCARGQRCEGGVCVPGALLRRAPRSAPRSGEKAECGRDADCRGGRVCIAQRCVRAPKAGPAPGGDGETVAVAPGAFVMGFTEQDIAALQPLCQELDPDCTGVYFRDAPAHEVALSGFAIDRTEVTAAQYAEFLNDLGDHRVGCGGHPCVATISEKDGGRIVREGGRYVAMPGYEDHPIVNVSWWGAQSFCRWDDKRLPTEAEWEKAARGTDGRRWPWGDEPITCDRALYANDLGGEADLCTGELLEGVSPDSTAPVGTYARDRSPYGALGMAGNVQEWVADWYGEAYYGGSPDENPPGPVSGDRKVRRGASWGHLPTYALTSFRDMTSPDTMGDLIGFRCVRSMPER